MKKLDPWDLVAAIAVLVLAAGIWQIYVPAAFIVTGIIGLAVAWLAAGTKR
jgi:hypothetical protein